MEALVSFEVPRRREAVQRRKSQAILSPNMANPTETDSERCDCPSLFHVLAIDVARAASDNGISVTFHTPRSPSNGATGPQMKNMM